MHQQQTAFKNIVEKEKIARDEQFLLFLQCFLLDQITESLLSIFLTTYLYLLLNWKSPKLACQVKGYTNDTMSVSCRTSIYAGISDSVRNSV